MKYYFAVVLFAVAVYGCSQVQKPDRAGLLKDKKMWLPDSSGLISGEQWQQVVRLKGDGQTKAAGDSLEQMILRNIRNKRGVGYLDFFLSNLNGFAGRRPYWEARSLSRDSLTYMKATLSGTLGYMQQLELLSPAASRKLGKAIASGVVYSPMEVFYLATALERSEIMLQSPGFSPDLPVSVQ